MKILVAGAYGQVGSELERQGLVSGHGIVATDVSQLDITKADKVNDFFKSQSPGIVINAAAYTAVDKAEDEKEAAIAINEEGPRHLAVACKDLSIPLIHISTDYVFDGSKGDVYKETDPVAPLGVYGESKWAGEEAVRRALPHHIILRTSWVFGAHGHNFVKTMLRLAAERDELRVVSDQIGGPTSAAGIAATILKICDRYASDVDLPWGTYHYSGYPFTSWHGFAEEIIRQGQEYGLIDHEVIVTPIATHEYPTPAKRPPNSSLSTELLESTFGIPPDNWKSSLKDMIRFLKENA